MGAVVEILFKKTTLSVTTALMTLCQRSNQLSHQRLHHHLNQLSHQRLHQRFHHHLRVIAGAIWAQVEVGSGEQSLMKTSVVALAHLNQTVKVQSITLPPRIEVEWPVFKRPQVYPRLT